MLAEAGYFWAGGLPVRTPFVARGVAFGPVVAHGAQRDCSRRTRSNVCATLGFQLPLPEGVRAKIGVCWIHEDTKAD